MAHGTHSGYVHGCRCGACTIASRNYKRTWKASSAAPVRHGTAYAYTNRSCRCALCREAVRVYIRDYRARKRAAVSS